jgi:hypothetical protein
LTRLSTLESTVNSISSYVTSQKVAEFESLIRSIEQKINDLSGSVQSELKKIESESDRTRQLCLEAEEHKLATEKARAGAEAQKEKAIEDGTRLDRHGLSWAQCRPLLHARADVF